MAEYVSFDYLEPDDFEEVTKLGGNTQFKVIATLDSGAQTIVDNKHIEWQLLPGGTGGAGYVTGDGTVYITNSTLSDITLFAKYKYGSFVAQYPAPGSNMKWKLKNNISRVDIITLPDIKNKYQKINDEQFFEGIFVYEDGSYKDTKNYVNWSSNDTNDTSIISVIPQKNSSSTGDKIFGRVLTTGEGEAQLTLSYTLDPTIKDTLKWNTHKSVVRLKINETPNDDLKYRMGKQKFTVTKIYDTGEEEIVSGNDINNLEWTVTPLGAAFIDATSGEAISLDTSIMSSQVIDNDDDEFNTDITLKVEWRGKNGEIDNNVECDQVHWRIQKKIIGVKIVGFDKNILPGTFSTAPSYARELRNVHGEQEFRAIFTYDDGTTSPLIRHKTVYEGQKTAILNGNEQVMGSIDKNDPNYINEKEAFDIFGETDDIIWTLQYIYNRDDGSEYAIDWKDNWINNENQLNKIADLYTYPFLDIIAPKSGTAAGSKNPYWRIKDENKSGFALIAHVTALKAGKCRLYCTYTKDKSIYDWIDFEVEKKLVKILINETPNEMVRQIDGTQQFTVTGYYDDGSEELITDNEIIQWNLLSDSTVANIDSFGTVTILNRGSVSIQATVKNIESNIVTWDIDKNVYAIKIIPDIPPNLAIGDTNIFEALWLYDDGSVSPVTRGLWVMGSSNDGKILDQWVENGYFKCEVRNTTINPHMLKITGYKGTISRSANVVWDPIPAIEKIELVLDMGSTTATQIGDQPRYKIVATYNNGDTQDISDMTGVEIV